MRFKGSFVAIITPFKNGKIDTKSLNNLIDFHLENQTDGIVPCGTTGESATLDYDEHKQVMELVVEKVNKKIPVIAGTGSNSTSESIHLTKYAQKIGCDGALVITPYYNKPTQKGLYEHFKAIAEEVNIPLILYNVPGRTSVNLLPETVARLASDFKNIVGIKEATGDLKQVTEVIRLTPDDFCVFSGDDFTTLPILCVGGCAAISVAANILPKETSESIHSFLNGDIQKAKELHLKIFTLSKALFLETNPIPVKTALSLMGKCSEEFRLPLCSMSKDNKEKLIKTLKEFNLI